MGKSLAFGAVHVGVAFTVGYALTGNVSVAGALTIVEPVCNTVAHYFFDRWWDRRKKAATVRESRLDCPCCMDGDSPMSWVTVTRQAPKAQWRVPTA